MAGNKWEYKVVTLKPGTFSSGEKLSRELEDQMNKLGQIGWELVEITNLGIGVNRAVFKR